MRPLILKPFTTPLLRPQLATHSLRAAYTMATTASSEPTITPLEAEDFVEWSRLFQGYLEFYKTSIPSDQYQRTFDRLLDANNELHGLVLRSIQSKGKLVGIAHYFPHMTPWNEGKTMLFNGTNDSPPMLASR